MTISPSISSVRPQLLVVDDDPGTILMLGKMLDGVGEIYFSTSATEALALIRERKPDIVLLDAEMPDMSGYDLCAVIKQDNALKDIPVIFVTAHTDADSEARSLEAGAIDFISKPLNPLVVQARVRAHLSLKQRNDERELRLVNVYRALSATNEAILRLESSSELFPLVCRIAVEYGGMMHAWVGIPDFEGRFVPVAKYGNFSHPQYEVNTQSKPDSREGRGPSGIAFRESRPVVVNDALRDELIAPWREQARKDGVEAIAVYPIPRGGNPYAVFSVYSAQVGAFDEETARLLKEMVANISFALDNFDREAWRLEGELALRQSEERFRTLFENAGDGIFISDLNGRYVDVNLRGAEMIGYSREEVIERRIVDIIAEHERARMPVDLAVLKEGVSILSEWEFLRKDGSTFIGEVSAQFISDGRIIGVLRDISERKRMMAIVEEKEQLLRLFIENSPVGIAMFDRNMRFLSVSKRFCDDYEVKSADLVGRSMYEVFPQMPERWRLVHQSCLSGETIRCEEDLVVDSVGGKILWLRWEVTPWYSAEEIGGVLLFSEVITERKEAEGRERRLTDIYRALSAANEAIVHLQAESVLLPLVCRIAVECAGFLMACIAIPDSSGLLVPVARYGKASGYLDEITILSKPTAPEGMGPSGIVFREGRSIVAHDFSNNELTVPWVEVARKYGIGASSTFPIKRGGKIYAIWTVYSERVDAFDEEIVQLLEYMASNISFALDNFDRETLRRQAETALRESEERFRLVADEAPFPMQIHAEGGKMLLINRAWTELTGYTLSDIPTVQSWLQKALGEEADRGQANFNKLFEKTERRDAGEYTLRCKNGEERIWHFFSSPLGKLSDGRRTVISMAVDVTERKQAEEGLQLAALVYQASGEAMLVADADYRIIAVNPAYEQITGYTAADVLGRCSSEFRSDMHGDDFYGELEEALQSTGYWRGEMWDRRRNGELYAVAMSINSTFNADGSVYRRVVLFSDITQKKQADEMLWQQANFDSLTGLPNRNLFRNHIEQEIRKARRVNMQMALMFLDLDGFKHVNDTLGHDMGDVLLKEAAQRLSSCMRETDTVARLGGDEFTVILTELQDPGSIERVARNILHKLAEPFHLGDEVAHVSASIGITLYPEDATEIEDLLKNADQAMYAAKQEGRNRYHYFTPSMQEAALERMWLVNDLRMALDGNQFSLVYQPIVELSSGIIHKVEALIRWNHPERGLINPLEFIPLAEDTGLIHDIGDWVFFEAASQVAKWREQYHPAFQVSVNISPVQFKKKNGIDSSIWFEHLKGLGLPGHAIVVEITEGLLLDASAKVTDQLLAFRDAGIEVALDDFGTGYSSLAYLKKFDIDYLKIDQTFIRNLTAHSDELALCEAIIVMAHKLGIKVIAEGVETIEQKDLLADAGCDYAQSFFFTGPVPASQLEKLLMACQFVQQRKLKM